MDVKMYISVSVRQSDGWCGVKGVCGCVCVCLCNLLKGDVKLEQQVMTWTDEWNIYLTWSNESVPIKRCVCLFPYVCVFVCTGIVRPIPWHSVGSGCSGMLGQWMISQICVNLENTEEEGEKARLWPQSTNLSPQRNTNYCHRLDCNGESMTINTIWLLTPKLSGFSAPLTCIAFCYNTTNDGIIHLWW